MRDVYPRSRWHTGVSDRLYSYPLLTKSSSQGFDPSVELESSAVKDYPRNMSGQRPVRQKFADGLRCCRFALHFTQFPNLFGKGRGGSKRRALLVVDDLGVNVTGASKYAEPRAGGASYDALPDPAMASQPSFLFDFVTDQLHSSQGRNLRPSLPSLPANTLSRVLHTFALIGFRRSETSDLRSHFPHLLFIRTGYRQEILTLHGHMNPIR